MVLYYQKKINDIQKIKGLMRINKGVVTKISKIFYFKSMYDFLSLISNKTLEPILYFL